MLFLFSELDLVSVRHLAQRVVALAEYRQRLFAYLQARMDNVAPSLTALIGETVGARLIAHAGSLVNLAKAPASTVQILGAEKALFRALKTRGNTPKYGLLFHSSFIGRAGTKNKGRIARYLANKCSIASRLDSFADAPNRAYGEALREQVEERLRFCKRIASSFLLVSLLIFRVSNPLIQFNSIQFNSIQFNSIQFNQSFNSIHSIHSFFAFSRSDRRYWCYSAQKP